MNSARAPTLARVSQWEIGFRICRGRVRIPLWLLLFHSYPVILLASVLLLLTAMTRQD